MDMPSAAQKSIPPGMIDLGIGQPSPWLLPVESMAKASAHATARRQPMPLAYGSEQGDRRFREVLAAFLKTVYGSAVDPDRLLVTNGASQGIDLVCTLFAKAGDAILVEEPTYFLARKIFADHRLNPICLPTDAEGLVVDALEDELRRTRPAFLYTIPTYHNPTSVCLSVSRRERLAELSRAHGLTVVADEVYHPLSYTAPPPPPMAVFCESADVVSLGSFSKILAPGLRLGWLQARRERIERITGCGLLDSGGGLNPFVSSIVGSAIELGLLEAHLKMLRNTYRRRMQAMAAALRERLADRIEFAGPEGGFFIWVRLPEGADAQALVRRARQQDVDFVPGRQFSSCGGLANFLRLSFAFYDIPELLKGVERLAEVI